MDKMIAKQFKSSETEKKDEEIKTEARHQILTEDMGKEPKQIMVESLDKFAEVKEFEDLANTLGDMMAL